MSEGPSIREITEFLADVRATRMTGSVPPELLARKADLLERIAGASPGNTEVAAIARKARAAADKAAEQ